MDRGSIDSFEIKFKSKFRNLKSAILLRTLVFALSFTAEAGLMLREFAGRRVLLKTLILSVSIGLLLGLPARLAWGQPQHQPTVDAPKQEPSAKPPAVAPDIPCR